MLNLEHLVLVAVGLLFWWPVLAGEPLDVSVPVKIGYLGVAFVGSVFLGLALTFSDTPFYDFYVAAPRLWGLSAAKDQNFGGILMNAEQSAVFLAAILYFVLRLIPEEEHTSSRA
jgi:cytochrome c oxidase assembly factor CtaG